MKALSSIKGLWRVIKHPIIITRCAKLIFILCITGLIFDKNKTVKNACRYAYYYRVTRNFLEFAEMLLDINLEKQKKIFQDTYEDDYYESLFELELEHDMKNIKNT